MPKLAMPAASESRNALRAFMGNCLPFSGESRSGALGNAPRLTWRSQAESQLSGTLQFGGRHCRRIEQLDELHRNRCCFAAADAQSRNAALEATVLKGRD